MKRWMVAALVAATAACGSPAAMDHIHVVTVTDDGVFVGTHNGLWRVSEDATASRVSDESWDIMGLAHDGQQFLASGHPGPAMNAPGNLGLQRSPDAGSTWQGVSLVGEVDFHRLAANGDTIAGIDSQTGLLLASVDGGDQWLGSGAAPFIDAAVLDSGDIVALTPDGRWRSADGGKSWQQAAEATVSPVVLAAAGNGLVAIDAAGRLLTAVSWDAPWSVADANLEGADAISVHGETIAVVSGDQVWISRDGGAGFTDAVTRG
jgi:hypothetical protein